VVSSGPSPGELRLFRELIGAVESGQGPLGIARVLHRHTGKIVIVEDAIGQVLATAGGQVPSGGTYEFGPTRPLPDDASHAIAIRNVDRWVAVACPRSEILGAISILDSGEQPTCAQDLAADLLALEQAATILSLVLGSELQQARRVTEAELALWDGFATELFEDSDADRVRSHAQNLGYDLDRSYRAVLVLAPDRPDLQAAVRRATERLNVRCLVTSRSDGVVMVVHEELNWADLARAIEAEGPSKVRIGVGGSHRLEDVRRSLADAELSLRLASALDKGVAVFDELGVWRILARKDVRDLQDLVDQWIGPLIEYDQKHHRELLKTLYAYLNGSGSLKAIAAKLDVHDHTVTYRLNCIQRLTGWNLDDPEHRLHLNLACRAYFVWRALEGPDL